MKGSILLAIAAVACAGNAVARDAAQDERDIRRTEAALCHAFETGDADTLRNGLDARFTLTDSKGHVTDRAQNLAGVARRDPRYDAFRNHDQTIRLYGDAAIVSGITSISGRSGASAFSGDFRFTDTWIRRDGRWLLAASHASPLAP